MVKISSSHRSQIQYLVLGSGTGQSQVSSFPNKVLSKSTAALTVWPN